MTDEQFKILDEKMDLIIKMIEQFIRSEIPKGTCALCHNPSGLVWTKYLGCHLCNPLRSGNVGADF